MGVVRKSITIPEDVYNKAKMLSDNFSSVVIAALREYLRKVEIDKAKKSFGSWEDRGKDSVSLVNEMRSDRNYVSSAC